MIKIRNRVIYSLGDQMFDVLNVTFIAVFTFMCVFPFINIVAKAFSSDSAIVSGQVSLIPVGFQLESIRRILATDTVVASLGVTILITVVGTAINMVITILMAYPLSRRDLAGKGIVMKFIIVTMLFSGGMIPGFLVVKSLGLLNTIWAVILPGALNTFNLIVLRTFFMGISTELEEAARIDGCSNMRILFQIILPLSTAALATLSLFYAVAHWNSYFSAMLYIDNPSLYTLQVKLRQLLLAGQSQELLEGLEASKAMLNEESLKAATIVFATVPILVVYPWLQKYFVKGVAVGAIKG